MRANIRGSIWNLDIFINGKTKNNMKEFQKTFAIYVKIDVLLIYKIK